MEVILRINSLRPGIWQEQRLRRHKSDRKQAMIRRPGLLIFTWEKECFLLKPAERTGEKQKLTRPYHGPFRVVKLMPNNAYIKRVDKPEAEPLLVAVDRLRRCPDEIPDTFWPPDSPRRKQANKTLKIG